MPSFAPFYFERPSWMAGYWYDYLNNVILAGQGGGLSVTTVAGPRNIMNGENDASPFFSEAIEEAQGKQAVIIPMGGNYLLRSQVTVLSRTVLRGFGLTSRVMMSPDDFTGSGMFNGGTSDDILEDVWLDNFCLDGRSQEWEAPAAGIHNFRTTAFDRLMLTRMTFQNSLSYGVGLQGSPAAANPLLRGPQQNMLMADCEFIFCGHGKFGTPTTLAVGVADNDYTFELTDGSVLDQTGGTLQFWPSGEICAHGAVSGNTVPISQPTATCLTGGRGICGTIPAAHLAGTTVFRLANGDGIDVKSGRNFLWLNPRSKWCSDKGLNPRCNGITIVGGEDDGSVSALGLNDVGSEVDTFTTLTAQYDPGDGQLEVASTTGFDASGQVRCDSGLFDYTSVDAAHFLGVTAAGITRDFTHLLGAGVSRVPPDQTEYATNASVHGYVARNNVRSAIAAAGGSGTSVCRVDLYGSWAINCGQTGFFAAGGGYGEAGGRGAVQMRIHGGGAIRCENGAVCENVEQFAVGEGWSAEQITEDGINATDQFNGLSVMDVTIGGANRGIREQGVTDWGDYVGTKVINAVTNPYAIIGANSSVVTRSKMFSNDLMFEQQVSAAWTPGTVNAGTTSAELDIAVADATALTMVKGVSANVELPAGCYFLTRVEGDHIFVAIQNTTGGNESINGGGEIIVGVLYSTRTNAT